MEAIDWVLSALGRPAERIVDLGAGTGKLTESLVGRAREVIAVEPDEAMLGVLGLPGRFDSSVTARQGSSDAIPVEDGSVDALFVGQAFHWFPRPASDRELARVLRPGGVLGLLWNLPDRNVDWIVRLYEITRDNMRNPVVLEWDPLVTPDFTAAEKRTLAHVHQLPGPDGVLNLIHTWSWVITRPADEQTRIDVEVRALIENHPELQGDTVSLPTNTLVIRHQRI